MPVDYTWPADGAVGWGQSVDNNLESMESRLNALEAAIANITSGTPGQPGPPGAPGPLSIRFCIGGVWQARPPGTETSPIINVSIGQTNAPTPPNAVEGDVWLY